MILSLTMTIKRGVSEALCVSTAILALVIFEMILNFLNLPRFICAENALAETVNPYGAAVLLLSANKVYDVWN